MGIHQENIAFESIKGVNWHGKKILDIGCGIGGLSLEIMDKTEAAEWVGIDTAMDRIATASKLEKPASMKFHVGNAEHLKFPDNSFDGIFCNMAFQQFKDPLKALEEMRRVLKDGGAAIINFNEEKSPFWVKGEEIISRLLGKETIVSSGKKIDRETFLELAENAGFSKIEAESKENTIYYKDADEVVNSMQLSPKLQGDNELKAKLDQEFRQYLDSIKNERGIPETWKMVFAKLVK